MDVIIATDKKFEVTEEDLNWLDEVVASDSESSDNESFKQTVLRLYGESDDD